MSTVVYAVEGMSCEHCVRAVTGEIGKIAEISDVSVDLAGKSVTVRGDPVDDAAVQAAIEEAGYTVVG